MPRGGHSTGKKDVPVLGLHTPPLSSSSSTPSSSGTRQRSAIACRYCRRRKIRCFGFDSNVSNSRCSNCIKFNQQCIFTPVSATVGIPQENYVLISNRQTRPDASQALYLSQGSQSSGQFYSPQNLSIPSDQMLRIISSSFDYTSQNMPYTSPSTLQYASNQVSLPTNVFLPRMPYPSADSNTPRSHYLTSDPTQYQHSRSGQSSAQQWQSALPPPHQQLYHPSLIASDPNSIFVQQQQPEQQIQQYSSPSVAVPTSMLARPVPGPVMMSYGTASHSQPGYNINPQFPTSMDTPIPKPTSSVGLTDASLHESSNEGRRYQSYSQYQPNANMMYHQSYHIQKSGPGPSPSPLKVSSPIMVNRRGNPTYSYSSTEERRIQGMQAQVETPNSISAHSAFPQEMDNSIQTGSSIRRTYSSSRPGISISNLLDSSESDSASEPKR
ncbi:uncharacterized protein V1516DRAFT_662960 [Lipomyces oligophaga]|uniref:uncharacterized protein n=1 Tax=Lipomyces oligophaga TaxID=45792 RepID=UPI0034CDD33C